MATFDKELIKSKLSNFKDKIDILITKNNYNTLMKKKVSIDDAHINGKVSINNTSSIFYDENKIRTTINSNTLDFTKDGKLKINGKDIMSNDEFIPDDINFNTLQSKYIKNENIPYIFLDGSIVSIESKIYLLGGWYSPKSNYIYDINTDTYTKNTDIPYSFAGDNAIFIGNNIYMIGSLYKISNGTSYEYPYLKYVYKYDIITDTYSRLSDIPYSFNGTTSAVNNNIYLLGSENLQYNYKYDTITDTYTKNTNIPYEFYYGSSVSVGTDIYLLGSHTESTMTNNYKYNTINDTYTKNTNIPFDFYYGSVVLKDNDIYLFFSNDSKIENYKYNINTDSYTKFKNMSHEYGGYAITLTTNRIYIMGGGSDIYANDKYVEYSKEIVKLPYNEIYTTCGLIYNISESSKIIQIVEDEYFTEYYGDEIIRSTYPVDENGNTKIYIKENAKLNSNKIIGAVGWTDINILDYM